MTLCDQLGVRLPIVQAPMAGAQGSALASAVAASGALGSLPCAMLDAAGLEAELTRMRAATDCPINWNFFCHSPSARSAEHEARWRAQLAPYYRELGLLPDAQLALPSRAPFDHDMADVLAAFQPALLSFHFGLPEPALLARVKSWGATILSSATTVAEARWLEAHGADVIIAQGSEAGGHRAMFLSHDPDTQVGTFALVPQIVHAVRVPVLAAGGIADARGVAAAFALGASGVQVGSAFLLAHETTLSPLQRRALASDAVVHTALTNVFTGRLARGMVNRVVREQGPISPLAPAFPWAAHALAPLRKEAESRGSSDFTPLFCGQSALRCREASARELVEALAAGLP